MVKLQTIPRTSLWALFLIIVFLAVAGCAPNIERLQSEGNVTKLISALEKNDHEIRRQAARALGEIGDPAAVEPLIAALEDEQRNVRQFAAEALGEIGDPRAVKPLIRAMAAQEYRFYGSIVRSLIKLRIGEQAIEPLTVALRALTGSNYRFTTDLVLDDMNDPEAVIPWITALGESGDARSAESLLTALGHPDETVRQSAVEALAKLGEPAIEPLISTFGMHGDQGNLVRQSAVSAFADIGEPALESLLAALDDEDFLVRDTAAQALGEVADPLAVERLKTVAFSDPGVYVRLHAAQALGAIGQPGIEPLVAGLVDTDPDIREFSSWALIAIGEPAKEPLIAALVDQDVWVRFRVADILIRNGTIEPVIDPLRAALEYSDFNMVERAAWLLGETGDDRAVQPLIDSIRIRSDGEVCGEGLGYAIDPLMDLGQHISNPEKIRAIENALIHALNMCDSKSIANIFLNSGNDRLERAARAWATVNGYPILSLPTGGSDTSWGSE